MVILDPDLEERTVAPSLDTFLKGGYGPSFEIDKKSEVIMTHSPSSTSTRSNSST